MARTWKLTVPADLDLSAYGLVEAMKPYREWCVPAALLNDHAAVRVRSEEEADVAAYGDLL